MEPSWRDIDDETRVVAILGSDHMNRTPIGHDPDSWFRYTIAELTSLVRNANKRADSLEQKLERLTKRLEEIVDAEQEILADAVRSELAEELLVIAKGHIPVQEAEASEEQRCALCAHEITFERCGSAFVNGGLPVCHTDDHSCYHRYTVYGDRPSSPIELDNDSN